MAGIIIGIVIAIILIAGIIISIWGFKAAFFNSPEPEKRHNGSYDVPNNQMCIDNQDWILGLTKEMEERPYESVSVQSYDGLKLYGRLIFQNKDAPLDICFHGWRSSGIRDFCAGGKVALEAGHNILLVDQRAQTLSEGFVMTFGIKERFDVVTWINWCVERFGKDVKIIVQGLSMGAATVLMASGLEYPANVKGFIADCPFSSTKKILKKVSGEDMGLPSWLFFPFVAAGALVYGKFNVNAITAADSVKNCKVPVLIIHGTGDTFVPDWMSKEIQDANPSIVQREIFPGAEHGLSYFSDHERYEKIVQEFWSKIL